MKLTAEEQGRKVAYFVASPKYWIAIVNDISDGKTGLASYGHGPNPEIHVLGILVKKNHNVKGIEAILKHE